MSLQLFSLAGKTAIVTGSGRGLGRAIAKGMAAAGAAVVTCARTGSEAESAAEEIRAAGGTVIVQDQATSVVWGMPGAIAQAGLADEILPIDRIPDAINRLLAGVPSASGAILAGGPR